MTTAYIGPDDYVFVCYPREDLALVQAELDRLDAWGVRIYFPAFEPNIADLQRVKGAASVLVLVSDSISEDQEVKKELSTALEDGKEVWAVHVYDVPLDGAVRLLLSGVSDLRKHSLEEDEYVRRLARLLPESTKTRPIDVPPEPVAAPPPSREPEDVPLADQLKALGPVPLAAGGVALVLVLLFFVWVFTSGDPETPKPVATASPSTPPSPVLDEATRLKLEAKRKAREDALKARRAAEEKTRNDRAAAKKALGEAEAQWKANEFKQVIATLTPVLAAQPKNAELALLRGRAHLREFDYKSAAADFDVVLEVSPKEPVALRGRGEARGRLDDKQGALADFKVLVEVMPKDDFAWSDLGDAHMELDQFKEAEAAYTQAIKLVPGSPGAYHKRSRARSKLGDAKGSNEDAAKASSLRNRR